MNKKELPLLKFVVADMDLYILIAPQPNNFKSGPVKMRVKDGARIHETKRMVSCTTCSDAYGMRATGVPLFLAHVDYKAGGIFIQIFIRDYAINVYNIAVPLRIGFIIKIYVARSKYI
jgi:hypothetical protein